MATSEGYEASNEYKGMVLHDGPTFNFNTYEVFKAENSMRTRFQAARELCIRKFQSTRVLKTDLLEWKKIGYGTINDKSLITKINFLFNLK